MTLEIDVQMDRDQTSFRPGETVTGTVTITCESEWKPLYAEVMLFWRTEGKGDRDDGVAGKLEIAEKGNAAPRVIEKNFSFQLPDMPWTYHGKALKIHWLIGAYAKAEGEHEMVREIPLIMHPDPDSFLPEAPT